MQKLIKGHSYKRWRKNNFIYVLKLLPAYKAESAWTKAVQETIGKHFNYLKQLTEKGTVVIAGRTDYEVANENVFGIVVLETESMESARKIMDNDPAVAGKIMSAEIHPFSITLLRKP